MPRPSTDLTGYRKIILTAMGLATLLALGGMSVLTHVSDAIIDSLSSSTVLLTLGGFGSNALEHFAKRPPAATTPASPSATTVAVDVTSTT